jgi:tetratricopeptide (TPR) repeat protein
MKFKTLFLLVIVLFYCPRQCVGATNNADKEESEGAKFLETTRAKFEASADQANSRGDFALAIKLLQQDLNKWKAKRWHSAWCEQTRKSEMISLMSYIARIYTEQKCPDKATKFYRQCEELNPEGNYAADAANAYRRCGDYKKAEEIYQTLIETGKPGNAPVQLDAHISLAQTFAEEGNLTAAEQTLNDFVSVSLTEHDSYQVRAARIALKDLLKTENRLSDVEKIDAILNDKTCPICGTISNVVPVSYGRRIGIEPVPSHFLGCTRFPGSPQWWCNKDSAGF